MKMIVSVVSAPESRAGKAEVGDTPIVNVPALPVNSDAESFSVPMDQMEPGGGLVGTAVGVGVLVGGLAANAGWFGIVKLRLSMTSIITTAGSRMMDLILLFMRIPPSLDK